MDHVDLGFPASDSIDHGLDKSTLQHGQIRDGSGLQCVVHSVPDILYESKAR
jgi:hypothetical protein